MSIIKVMVNGLPGDMSANVARHILKDERFHLVPFSLTGPEIEENSVEIDSVNIDLLKPQDRDNEIKSIKDLEQDFISVDYTHPTAVNLNAKFYCKNNLPFVMGTTGGKRKELEKEVLKSSIPAIIAPNMGKQIVGFQAMMEYAANTFPDLFKDFSLTILESHQSTKADTSGTARAMVSNFNKMGVAFTEDEINMERNPELQKSLGIPEEYLKGHAWHTYSLTSSDDTVHFRFVHNINGRDIYSRGTLDAVVYLFKKINEGQKSVVYSMIDVLKNK